MPETHERKDYDLINLMMKKIVELVETTFFLNFNSMRGWMYILECNDGSYYTGSTIDLPRRFRQHSSGEGANYTKKRLPVKIVYFEEYPRIYTAFYREKQVQGWSRKKKEALISGQHNKLPELAKAYRDIGVKKINQLYGEIPQLLPEALEGNN